MLHFKPPERTTLAPARLSHDARMPQLCCSALVATLSYRPNAAPGAITTRVPFASFARHHSSSSTQQCQRQVAGIRRGGVMHTAERRSRESTPIPP
jgi:hypothetical protein